MAKSKSTIRERIEAFARELFAEIVQEVIDEVAVSVNEGSARGGPRRKSRKKRSKKKAVKKKAKTTTKTRRLNASNLQGQTADVFAFIKKNKKGVTTDQIAKGLKIATQSVHSKTSILAKGKLIQKQPVEGTNKKIYLCP